MRVIAFRMAQALREARVYVVETAADGEECLAKARQLLPGSSWCLDIMMPKMHGIEVLKTLRDEHRTARTGVISRSHGQGFQNRTCRNRAPPGFSTS